MQNHTNPIHRAHNLRSRRGRALTAGLVLTVSLVGLAAAPSPAHAVGPPCPGVNVYLVNSTPSPTCAVYGPQVTLENKAPFIVERKPAYGWWPATCIIASDRWDSGYNVGAGFPWGWVTAGARVVQDDGYCTGPTVSMAVSITVSLHFANIYGVGAWYPSSCQPSAGGSGVTSLNFNSVNCAGATYAGAADDWQRGYYRADLAVATAHGWWNIPGVHQLY